MTVACTEFSACNLMEPETAYLLLVPVCHSLGFYMGSPVVLACFGMSF